MSAKRKSLQTLLAFFVLAAVLCWSALVPRLNPFDALYNWTLVRPGGTSLTSAPAPRRFAQFYETAANLAFRQVFTDGRPLPDATEHTWLGYSIGKWEGDRFVVETTGLKDGGWLDTDKARPHSDALRVTERFRRTDFGHMELTITIDDPKAYLKPWTVKTALNLVPDMELLEGSCDKEGGRAIKSMVPFLWRRGRA